MNDNFEQAKSSPRYDETDFNKAIKESFDFLLVTVTPSDETSHMISVSMKNSHSMVNIMTAILMDDDSLRNNVMTNLMALQMNNSKDKTIN